MCCGRTNGGQKSGEWERDKYLSFPFKDMRPNILQDIFTNSQ